jgi:hypothetical protein
VGRGARSSTACVQIFSGLFQPDGRIWQLADYQARIAALQISGRLRRPSDIVCVSATKSHARVLGSIRRPGTRSRSTTTPSGTSSWPSPSRLRIEHGGAGLGIGVAQVRR